MSNVGKKLVSIPRIWCETVSHILRSLDKQCIITTSQSDRDWYAAFPDTWNYHRYKALASALDVPGVIGRHIVNMEPKCDAYEYWFSFRERKLIGKIGLLPDGRIIIIFSSHIPRKGEDKL